MLRANLSTRPFYNERGVHAIAAVLAVAILAVTGWQIARVLSLSRYKTELNSAIKRDRNEADYSTKEAQNIRRGLDQKQLAALAAAAAEANDLIAQRTFSWTELFNQLEATLPDDVMLMAVHPAIKGGVTEIQMDVQGRGEDVIEQFWDRLEKTGRFHNVEWTNVSVEDGLHRMTMTAQFGANTAAIAPAAAPRKPAGVAK